MAEKSEGLRYPVKPEIDLSAAQIENIIQGILIGCQI
jgi:hypothetical protein